jgi:hypothetical protein
MPPDASLEDESLSTAESTDSESALFDSTAQLERVAAATNAAQQIAPESREAPAAARQASALLLLANWSITN